MRAPVDTIAAPPFPKDLPWVNVAPLRMDKQVGRPVLVEFWDFCRPNSLRTLPYVKAWHERYAADGLRVISVHTPGFPASSDEAEVRAAVGPLRPEDDPEARIVVPTPDVAGPYSGPYVAGTVWAILDGRGTVAAN